MSRLLDVEGLEIGYGDAGAVVEDFHCQVDEQSTIAILGANGAGKSTVLKAISGLLPPRRGRIVFGGEDVTAWPARHRVRAGMTYVPESREIVYSLNVKENLLLGGHRASRTDRNQRLEMVAEMFPEIAKRLNGDSWRLSGGEQQMLAIGRALMSGPRLLLMDEPSLGLAPIIVKRVFHKLSELGQQGHLSILLVEQNFRLALGLVSYVYFMRNGEVVKESVAGAIREDENSDELVSSYLGGT